MAAPGCKMYWGVVDLPNACKAGVVLGSKECYQARLAWLRLTRSAPVASNILKAHIHGIRHAVPQEELFLN